MEGREILWKPSGIQNDVGRQCSSTIMLNIGIWSGPTYAMTRATDYFLFNSSQMGPLIDLKYKKDHETVLILCPPQTITSTYLMLHFKMQIGIGYN